VPGIAPAALGDSAYATVAAAVAEGPIDRGSGDLADRDGMRDRSLQTHQLPGSGESVIWSFRGRWQAGQVGYEPCIVLGDVGRQAAERGANGT
jgi:hypothetical protein